MTVWVDVSDVYRWTYAQLSGIQRTVVFVIEELSRRRADLRLFRFDPKEQRLLEVTPESLPVAVRKCLPWLSAGAASAIRQKSAIQFGRNIETRATLRRYGSWFIKPLKRAIGGIRTPLWLIGRKAKSLIGLISNRSLQHSPVASRARRKPLQPGVLIRLGAVAPLFQPGDVCLSLSATWNLPGYGDAIAANLHGGRVKCINMIYDLTPVLFPNWASEKGTRSFTHWVRGQIRNADLVLAISHFQKKEIEAFLSESALPHRPIEVVRLGDTLPASATMPPRPRYVPNDPFVLCVSTLHVRKNHHCLYQVWRQLATRLGPQCPRLLLVGIPTHVGFRDLLHQMRHDRLVNRLITHLSEVCDKELAWYYKHCLFTVYPSFYEGWGLPISESLQSGKYCIASSHESMQEAGGDLVDYFDPFDYKACLDLIHRAITQPEYVKAREEEIRRRYVPTSWAVTAQQICAAVDRVSGRTRLPEEEESLQARAT